jgi:hypothetical protein
VDLGDLFMDFLGGKMCEVVEKSEGQREDIEEQVFPSCLYLTPSLARLRTEAIESSEYTKHATSFGLAYSFVLES